jgi:uncharacterized membrane protein
MNSARQKYALWIYFVVALIFCSVISWISQTLYPVVAFVGLAALFLFLANRSKDAS